MGERGKGGKECMFGLREKCEGVSVRRREAVRDGWECEGVREAWREG